eukprot:gene7078-7291_t
MRLQPVVAFALLLVALVPVARASSYTYDFGYDSEDYEPGYDEYAADDEYNYYKDDDQELYNEEGAYAEDFLDYSDYYYDLDEYDDNLGGSGLTTCTQDQDGKFNLTSDAAACDIEIKGVDNQAPKLNGGIDGVYKIVGCHGSKAKYQRQNSPPGEDRVLFSAPGFGDWDISKGAEVIEADILMYGGDLEKNAAPLFVLNWELGADLMNITTEEEYVRIQQVTIKCTDGQVFKPPAFNPAVQKRGPGLTREEEEAKWKQFYDSYGRRPAPNPTVNISFLILLVMFGLSIVLVIPYAVVKRRPAKGYQPVSTSFAQVIQQSKKKQSGHVN